MDRLRELLAGEAAGERLEDAEWLELDDMLASMPAEERRREREGMEETAALAQAAFLAEDRASWRAMPEDFRERMLAIGRARALDMPPLTRTGARTGNPRNPEAAPTPRRPFWNAGWGWAAAAAMLVAWLSTAVLLQQQQPFEASQAIAAADARILPWRSEISAYEQVQGEIVWSDALQAGEMRFTGLPANDPKVAQYQLWIVDPDRYRNPVDGGVFNAAPSGESVVAVQAKLPVAEPVAFAITLEQAGGVVVSEGPLLLVAAERERPHASL